MHYAYLTHKHWFKKYFFINIYQ